MGNSLKITKQLNIMKGVEVCWPALKTSLLRLENGLQGIFTEQEIRFRE